MAHYDKGASAERELIKMFWEKGFAAVRVAGSGKNALPMPDLVVLGKGMKIIIESKAWRAKYLSIETSKVHELLNWGRRGDADVYVAWKYPNKGWIFIKPKHFNKSKYYTISFEKAQHCGIPFDVLIGEQKQIVEVVK